MEKKSKQLNTNHIPYNNDRVFLNLKKQIKNNEYEYKNNENIKNKSFKTCLMMNYPYNNYLQNNNLSETKNFKGAKILANNYYKYFQKTQNKHSCLRNLKACKIFFEKKNKINKSNTNSANDIFNVKISKTKRTDNSLNRSCPMINKYNFKNSNKKTDNTERNIDTKMTPITSSENEKIFTNGSNICKIEYLKKIIRKHYFDNFGNLKDYFNKISGNGHYLSIDDIIFYLREIIKVKIDKKEIRQLLYIYGIIKVDFNNFKFIFFPDLKNNKTINLKLKNEKCGFLKKEINININCLKNLDENKNNINKNTLFVQKEESNREKSKETTQSKIRVFQKKEIAHKLKIRGLSNKMRFFLMDINKEYILRRFNEKYKFSINDYNMDNLRKINSNRNICKKIEKSKRIQKNIDKKDNINLYMTNSKSYNTNNNNKEKLKLFVLKIKNIDINKLEDIEKNSATHTNISHEKKLKIEEYNNHKINYKLDNNLLSGKSTKSNRYLRNEIKNNDFVKNENETSNNTNKLQSFNNKTKGVFDTFELKKNKTINQHKESEIKYNECLNLDSNKAFLFFKSEEDNNNTKEGFTKNNTQNLKELRFNKNSDILNFL